VRLQLQNRRTIATGSAPLHNGSISVIREILQKEGVPALFKVWQRANHISYILYAKIIACLRQNWPRWIHEREQATRGTSNKTYCAPCRASRQVHTDRLFLLAFALEVMGRFLMRLSARTGHDKTPIYLSEHKLLPSRLLWE
jgi:hypothetical protein